MKNDVTLLITGIFIILICSNFQNGKYSNENEEPILMKQKSVKDVIDFEKSINPNVNFITMSGGLTKDFYPLAEKYKTYPLPIIAKREPIGYLPLYAQYFYTKNDSIVRLILYEWEKEKYSDFNIKLKVFDEERRKLEVYNQEFERILRIVVKQLGKPQSLDEKLKLKKSNSQRGDYFVRDAEWDTIEYNAKLNLIFERMTYRVRLKLYWKK